MKLGKISNAVLDRSVIKRLGSLAGKKKEKIRPGMDAGLLEVEAGQIAMSIETGQHAAISAFNNLYVSGAIPKTVECSISLAESDREIKLRKIEDQLAADIAMVDATVLGGETIVSNAVNKPLVTVCALGQKKYSLAYEPKAGDDIIMTKYIGMGGVRSLIEAKREEILERLPLDYLEKAYGSRSDLLIAKEAMACIDKASYMHDASKGGILAALWDLGQYLNMGFSVDMRKISVSQAIIEVCEIFDINPYHLDSTGCLLMTSPRGCDILDILNGCGLKASIIGTLQDGNERILINNEDKRYLDEPQPDEITKYV